MNTLSLAKYFLAVLCALAMASAAQAKWYEASSDHFVIYADDSEKDIRRFAENLERFHSGMAFITQRDIEKPSPSNRVTIFVVGNQREIRKLVGGESRNVAGFYIPRAGASKAFVQDIRFKNGYPHFSTIVLLHEYAHHFLMSSTPFAMPRWVNEGAAEFFAAASFERDGSVWIGRPALHRAGDFAFADKVSIYELFDHKLYEKNKGQGHDAFYAQSWLTYHYLTFSPERRGQLNKYMVSVANSTSSTEAAKDAFGDLGQLEKELKSYLRSRRMPGFKLTPEMVPISPVTLRELPEGEAKMMEVRIRSQRGVTREQAEELLPEAREIAAKYPNDPGVLAALAEAEHDAGNDVEAIRAADAAIALDPTNVNALVQKGYSLFRMAGDAKESESEASYARAIDAFTALNQIENDHPLPLIYYYRSFAQQGKEPPENARHALERASELAPFDQTLAFNAAVMFANEGKIALANYKLAPIAANPHGGRRASMAEFMMSQMKDAEEGKPFRLSNLSMAVANVRDELEGDKETRGED
ncbi:MAG: hypothetical protein AAGK17_02550 [Pseudomonadota bacterium]